MAQDIAVAESLRKSKYKALIILLKVIPMLIALCYVINTFLWIFGINAELFSYIGSTSLLTLMFLYLASHVFEFCEYHRMFLHYVLVDNIVSCIDYYFEIGIHYVIYLTIIGLFLFLILYLHQKETRYDRLNKTTAH